MRASLRVLATAAVLATAWSCTVKQADNPAETGPSEFALSLTMQASPDVLPQDGASQSVVAIQARDANNRPVSGLSLRADIVVDGVVQDFGQLSTKSLQTAGDGRASVTYTAPGSVEGTVFERNVQIRVWPVGTDSTASIPRVVNIRLVSSGVITPGGPTVPNFLISPNPAAQSQVVIFDASDVVLDLQLVVYDWDFGDGSSASGRIVQHAFDDPGSFVVTLTVTDTTGNRASRPKTVTVDQGSAPAASFVFSPTEPEPGDTVFFNASGSTAADGRTLVSYTWNFGTSLGTASGKIVSKVFPNEGTYSVTLTVKDDLGNTNTTSQDVPVGVEGP
jgi:PKD repeat protein